jgi:hypothetical protein
VLETKACHVAIGFFSAVWFIVTAMACRIFLAPCSTCHKFIFVPKIPVSLTLILLVTLSMTAIVYQRSGVQVLVTNETYPYLALQIPLPLVIRSCCHPRWLLPPGVIPPPHVAKDLIHQIELLDQATEAMLDEKGD